MGVRLVRVFNQPERNDMNSDTNDETPLAAVWDAFDRACQEKEARYKKKLERERNAQLRREAKAREETTYTGTPCRKPGHGARRVTANGLCHECHLINNREYRARQRAVRDAMKAVVAKHGIQVDLQEVEALTKS